MLSKETLVKAAQQLQELCETDTQVTAMEELRGLLEKRTYFTTGAVFYHIDNGSLEITQRAMSEGAYSSEGGSLSYNSSTPMVHNGYWYLDVDEAKNAVKELHRNRLKAARNKVWEAKAKLAEARSKYLSLTYCSMNTVTYMGGDGEVYAVDNTEHPCP